MGNPQTTKAPYNNAGPLFNVGGDCSNDPAIQAVHSHNPHGKIPEHVMTARLLAWVIQELDVPRQFAGSSPVLLSAAKDKC